MRTRHETDAIPIVETYRGIGIHADQSRERIERVVKPDIDLCMENSNMSWLLAFANSVERAPEARMLAQAKAETIFTITVETRRARPDVTIEFIRAHAGALDSRRYRSATHFCSIFDGHQCGPGDPGPARRDAPLDDCE